MISVILPIAFVALLECLLSFDNALALAAMVKHLPKQKQKKALTYGIWGAYIFRIGSLKFLVYLMNLTFVKVGAGLYLLYLSINFFCSKPNESKTKNTSAFSFWKTVLAVEITDIAFSADSIMAAVGVSSKLFIVIIGGLIGIFFMRFAAYMFVKLIAWFPRLESTAFLLVTIVGARLIFDSLVDGFPGAIEEWVVYVLMGLAVFYGLSYKKKEALA